MAKLTKIMLILIPIILIISVFILLFMNSKKFGQLPKGERLQRIKDSPNYRDGKFQNLEPTKQFTGEKRSLISLLDFFARKSNDLRPSTKIEVEKNNLYNLNPQQNNIIWFGHSSYLLQLKTHRFLVDPVFVTASPVCFFNKAFKGTDIFKPEDIPDFDYLIITHDHWDHLDYETVKRLKGRFKKVICPLGVGQHFQHWGFASDEIIEFDWNQQAFLDDNINIYCLPARHFSGRSLVSNQTLWASFLIEIDNKKVFLSGDGGYGEHFKTIGETFEEIDFAILENGQYNQDWKYIHMIPDKLELAIQDLNAQKVMTTHHSKYALSKHPWNEPLENVKKLKEKGVNILMPKIGEIVELY